MVKFYAAVYGWGAYDEEMIQHIATKFDLLDTHVWNDTYAVGLDKMKVQNPDLKLLIYWDAMGAGQAGEQPDWDVINAHEEWFVHDKNGNRIQRSKFPWFAMDVGHAGWREHFANEVLARINKYKLDGVFADDVWAHFPCEGYSYNPWLTPLENIPKSIDDRWHNDMLEFLQYLKSRLGDKLLIINPSGDFSPTGFLSACDGLMDEEFVHPTWYSSTQWEPNYIKWRERVDRVRACTRTGKHILVHGGFSEIKDVDYSIVHRMVMYSLCSFLLAAEGPKCYFGYSSMYNQYRQYFEEEYEDAKKAGNPKAPYIQLQENLFARDFDHAKVFVNCSADATYTVEVEGVPHTLEPHSGLVVPWKAPPTPPSSPAPKSLKNPGLMHEY